MSTQQDREDLLDALYALHTATGERPSVVEAQLLHLPNWTFARAFDAADALEASGDILNVAGPFAHVDLSPAARKRASGRAKIPTTPTGTGGRYHSPAEYVPSGAIKKHSIH